MRTRKKGIKKHKKRVTHFKIYKGGRSSGSSSKMSDRLSLREPVRVSSATSSAALAKPVSSHALSLISPGEKFESKIVDVGKLPGHGRDRALSYHANIHSQGDSVPESIDKGLDDKVRDVFDLNPPLDSPTKRKRKVLARRIRENIPHPPPVELSPSGRGLLTSYTPELDIVEDATRIPILRKDIK